MICFACDVAFALLLMPFGFRYKTLKKASLKTGFENWFSLLFIVSTCARFRSSSSKPLCVNRRVARNSQWGGCFGGSGGGAPSRRRPMEVWGQSPQPPEANGGLGAKPPAAGGTGVWGRSPQRSKIMHFFLQK